MNVALIALLGLTIVGFLILLDRRDKRAHEERQAHRLEIAGLAGRLDSLARTHLTALADLEDKHRREAAELCQRLQAPEFAVVEHQQAQAGPDEPYPLTDEESASAQEARAAIERIEELENAYGDRVL